MTWPAAPGIASLTPSSQEELVVTITNGVVTKIERLDQTTQTRRELSPEEYSALAASYYAAYFAGIRDYAQAVASGDTATVQAYYQGMTLYLSAFGQI